MSYCRFGESDIYLFSHVDGGIECCSCALADKVKSIFTTGAERLLGVVGPCKECSGVGCDACMVCGNTRLADEREALAHVAQHRARGPHVPDHVDERLRREMVEAAMKERR